MPPSDVVSATSPGADLVDAVPPRPLVPTPREVESGTAPADFEFRPLPPPPPVQRFAWVRYLAEPFTALNPRRIAGPDAPARPLVVLALISGMGLLDLVGFSILLIFIRAELNFDFTILGAITVAVSITKLLTFPMAGYLADRVSRVWMIRAGVLITALATLAGGLFPGVGVLLLTRTVNGLGPALRDAAQGSLIADYYPAERRARCFIFLQAITYIGFSLGLAGILLVMTKTGAGWRSCLILLGLAQIAAALALFLISEPIRGAVDRRAMGASEEVAVRTPKPVGWAEAWRTLSSITTLRRVWYATPFIWVSQTGIFTLIFYITQQRYARGELSGPGLGILTSDFALVAFVLPPALITIALLGFSAPVADRLMRQRPGRVMVAIGVCFAVQALGVLPFLYSRYFWVNTIGFWLIGGISNCIVPAQFTMLSVVVPARVRAMGFTSIAPWQLFGLLLAFIPFQIANKSGETAAVIALVPVFLMGAAVSAFAGGSVAKDMRAALAASVAEEAVAAARREGRNKMLVCRQVEVTYEGTQVLFGVDLDIVDGEILAVLGTNGAGKSTLLRTITGIQEASGGAIFLDGEDITHRPPHINARGGVVFLPGGRAVFPSLTVEENLRTAAWLYRDDPESIKERTEQVLTFFPVLRERLQQQAGNMSGGEQQMLALSQAFLMRPRLLMIDELTLGLAPAVIEQLLEIVHSIHAQGTTVMLVEQSVNVAITLADRAIFLDKGEIRFDGPTEELLRRPELVRSVFLGGAGKALTTSRGQRLGSSEGAEVMLRVRGAAVSFGAVSVLDGVDLEVHAGEIVGVIGPNGAGKTTLLDVVSGFVRLDSGSVSIQALEATALAPDARARLGLARAFQNGKLFPSLTVRDNIAVALERRLGSRNPLLAAAWIPTLRRSERRAYRRVEYLVDLLGLGRYADKFVNELSTGSRRFVEIACILASEPRMLLLDEPSSGLAQAEVELLGPTIKRLAAESGCGVLVIEHDLPLVTGMSDRLIALERGRVIAEGDPDAVLRDEEVVRAYLNASQAVINRSGALANALAAVVPVPAGHAGSRG